MLSPQRPATKSHILVHFNLVLALPWQFLTIYIDITLLFTSMPSKWHFKFRFSDKKFRTHFSHLLPVCVIFPINLILIVIFMLVGYDKREFSILYLRFEYSVYKLNRPDGCFVHIHLESHWT